MSVTPRQRNLINDLLEEREVSAQGRDAVLTAMGDARIPPRDFRPIIDRLMAAPRRTRSSAASPSTGPAPVRPPTIDQRLRSTELPKGRYAIPRANIALGSPLEQAFGANEHIFVEVKEYQETRYIRQLHGAPGSYTRSKPTREQQDQVIDTLTLTPTTPLECAQLFGVLRSCCGSCGADLTDDRSRALHLGPDVSAIFILPRMCASCETGRHVRCNGRVDGKPCHCPLLLEHGMYPLQTTVDRLLEQTADGE
jgi:hypothetical protein